MKRYSFVVHGKLALPYQYFAGTLGSKFIKALRMIRGSLEQGVISVVVCMFHLEVCVTDVFLDIKDNMVDVSNEGTVITYTVVNHCEGHYPLKPPFVLALIKLDGTTTPMVHIVKGVPASKMRSNVRVRAVFFKRAQRYYPCNLPF